MFESSTNTSAASSPSSSNIADLIGRAGDDIKAEASSTAAAEPLATEGKEAVSNSTSVAYIAGQASNRIVISSIIEDASILDELETLAPHRRITEEAAQSILKEVTATNNNQPSFSYIYVDSRIRPRIGIICIIIRVTIPRSSIHSC